ncbi:glycoside hydrolase family 93 protein [Apodospora peruviana]|uniref:Glycoside hydrolase family 93 protein n=1 Tax=Apodospora peruviana TaxID=516989 RepID=A0AAE0IAW8_9PEZI|nr:glycoside hydrolase family 93 protein [Apodospora peruviana]
MAVATIATNLLGIVSTNLGLRDNNIEDDTTNNANTDPAPRSKFKFHIAPHEHFVHPLPGTYPRLCRLADGSILFGFTSFGEHGERILTTARSIDGGKSFTPHGEVTRRYATKSDCDNLFLLQLPPDGDESPTILAAFRNHDVDPNTKSPTYFRITVCQSTDAGRSWTYLSQAYESTPAGAGPGGNNPGGNNSGGGGAWEPFLRLCRVRPGEIQLFFSLELNAQDQDTVLVVSRDRGRTWSEGVHVTGAGEQQRDGMVGIAETIDDLGRDALVLVLETTRGEDGTKMAVEALLSYDDGETWGWRQTVYMPQEGARNAGAPQVASFADGELAVVFMTDEDSAAGGTVWPRGAKVKVLFGSRPSNGRIFWHEDGVPGGADDNFWPGVMRADENKVLVVYENGGIIKGRLIAK